MSWRDCWCHCHSMVPADRIGDRIAAASACPECRDDHVQKYVKESTPIKPPPDISTVCDDSQSDGIHRRDDEPE